MLGLTAAALVLTGCSAASEPTSERTATQTTTESPASAQVADRLAALEEQHDVKIGVSAVDAQGKLVEYRADDRFGYASTVKVFAAATLLAEKTPQERAKSVRWTQADIDAAGYSPVTSAHLERRLTLDELAEGAVRDSDNTAMNLVLRSVGGAEAVEKFLRTLGDDRTQLDSYEPDLNTVTPGKPANTTTPAAFRAALRVVLEKNALEPQERRTLLDWMSGNSTGDALIRAGLPAEWKVADKSGGSGGMRNDIGVVTGPGGQTVYLAVFTSTNDPEAEYDDVVVAEAARAVLAEYS
ncbi:class A beta-lactamase [Aeromicrobium duanguangcaii]|uniref:class A beta-lactamase n=1 Tax=Aeromicrobium duanguangcaii TaxID=2968086 RepID=UPI00201710DE|nr:class A beta-lactamase [Aeromicrobium duanguangcaii]MCL3837099.1 class A beta-lactamase [Aeromicrobium duanguangcaii]